MRKLEVDMQAIPYIIMAVTAVASVQAAEAQADTADYNRKVAVRNANTATDQAARDEEQHRRNVRMQLGAERANYGASGISPEGSPLDVLEMSAANAEMDSQNIRYKGSLRALGHQTDAALEEFSGGNARRQGRLSAATTLAGGMYKQPMTGTAT